jgi:hypothetical protein
MLLQYRLLMTFYLLLLHGKFLAILPCFGEQHCDFFSCYICHKLKNFLEIIAFQKFTDVTSDREQNNCTVLRGWNVVASRKNNCDF